MTKVTEQTLQILDFEAGLLGFTRHPNIIKLLHVRKQAPLGIVCELAKSGSLKHILFQPDHSNFIDINIYRVQLAKDIARGMAYLHAHDPPICHRDLKSSNILICEGTLDESEHSYLHQDEYKQYVAKIADFGIASYGNITPDYKNVYLYDPILAPEQLQQIKNLDNRGTGSNSNLLGTSNRSIDYDTKPHEDRYSYTEKTDIFAFGIVLWEMFTQENASKFYETFESREEFINYICSGKRPPMPEETSSVKTDMNYREFKNIILECWDAEPKKRPTFQQCLNRLEKIKEFKVERVASKIPINLRLSELSNRSESQSSFTRPDSPSAQHHYTIKQSLFGLRSCKFFHSLLIRERNSSKVDVL